MPATTKVVSETNQVTITAQARRASSSSWIE